MRLITRDQDLPIAELPTYEEGAESAAASLSPTQRRWHGLGAVLAIGAGVAVEYFLFKNPYDQMSPPGILFGGLDTLGLALGYSAITGKRLAPNPTEGSEQKS